MGKQFAEVTRRVIIIRVEVVFLAIVFPVVLFTFLLRDWVLDLAQNLPARICVTVRLVQGQLSSLSTKTL